MSPLPTFYVVHDNMHSAVLKPYYHNGLKNASYIIKQRYS